MMVTFSDFLVDPSTHSSYCFFGQIFVLNQCLSFWFSLLLLLKYRVSKSPSVTDPLWYYMSKHLEFAVKIATKKKAG